MFIPKVRGILFVAMVTLAALAGNAAAVAWSVSVSEQDGLPAITKGGGKAVTSAFAFWGNNWAWADQRTEFKVTAPFEYAILGKNNSLNFDLSGLIRKGANQQLIWDITLDAHSSLSDVIGGGMVFKFDLATFGQEMSEPELLPDNRGWAWGHLGGNRIEMRFDSPMAAVYFERGQKEEVRAFFYTGAVQQGMLHHTANLSGSGDMVIGQTISERFGLVDSSIWPTDILDAKTSPVDLSFLNSAEKPAGKRGFVKVAQEKLLFEDGTPARFWGTNLAAYALYGTPAEAVKQQARRLSELGFNLVRLHHMDSPWVNPNIFGDQNVPDTQNLSAAALDKLDWWIKCLKDEGIYVWLDLHVQRGLREGDHIDAFTEIIKGKPTADLKGFNYVNPSIKQAMKRFNDTYVNHINAYTGIRYAAEPAIAAMLITNENDVTHHFGHALLPDKKVPQHNAIYMSKAAAFAAANGLPTDKTWRSWEPGPSKLFLNDLEYQFNADMIAQLRSLGVKVPIATTSSWGTDPLSSLPALTAGGVIDAHSYGGIGELEKNPLFAPNLVDWIAAAQVAGKPLTVTEWNVEAFPAPDRHAIPLYVAASARLQGWDALMQYAYSQVSPNEWAGPSNWHAFNDPSLIATLPAAALLYRQGHVQEAVTTYVFAPSREQLFYQSISPQNSLAIRTAAEKGKLIIALPQTKELPWLEKNALPMGAKVITDPNQSMIGSDAAEVVSDTGELRRNWDNGTYTINTLRTQAAMGWIGGQKIELQDVEIAAATRNATVAVQSLDGNPIGKSHNILISLGARSIPTTPNKLPYFSEPVEGVLTIRAPRGLKLFIKNAARQDTQIPAPYLNGGYVINLDKTLRTYWLFLKG